MFSDNLRFLRKQRGLTQAQLGKLIGKGESSISEWESGEYESRSSAVSKVAAFFGVTMQDLMEKDLTTGSTVLPTTEPFDPDVQEILDLLDRNEDLKILFKKTGKLENGDLKQVVKVLKALLPNGDDK